MENRITTPLFLIVALAAFLPTCGLAQEEKEKKKIIVARTLCFKQVADKADIFVASGETPIKILLPIHNYSRAFKCSLEKGEALFYKEEGVDDNGEPKKVMMARAKVGKGLRKVLFYFIPAQKKGELPYRVIVMDDSLVSFPLGETRLLNLSQTEVAFRVGEHNKVLASGKMSQVGAVKKVNRVKMARLVCLMKDRKGKWKTINESRTRFSKRLRILVVSYVNSSTGRPLIRVYQDIPLKP